MSVNAIGFRRLVELLTKINGQCDRLIQDKRFLAEISPYDLLEWPLDENDVDAAASYLAESGLNADSVWLKQQTRDLIARMRKGAEQFDDVVVIVHALSIRERRNRSVENLRRRDFLDLDFGK